MSEPGIIDVRDIASFVEMVREGDSVSAHEIAAANVVWSIWTELGSEETNPDIDIEEAKAVVADLPLVHEEENQ